MDSLVQKVTTELPNISVHTSKATSGHHCSGGWMMGGGARDSIPLFDCPSIMDSLSLSHLPFVFHLASFGSLSFPTLYNPLSLSAPHSPMNYGIANNAEIYWNSAAHDSPHGRRAVAGVTPSVVLQCTTEPGCTTKKTLSE